MLTVSGVLILLMQPLQERIEDLMKTKGWSVGKVATIAEVSSSAVSQWLGRGGTKSSKSIGNYEAALRLEKESGFNAMWLAKGKGPKLASMQAESSNTTQTISGATSKDIAGQDVSSVSEVAQVSGLSDTDEALCQTIPTSMPYAPTHLKSAILLMGNLLGHLDLRSKRLIGDMLQDLALSSDNKEEIEDIAEKAAALARMQKPVTKNLELNKAIRGRGDPVETGPAPLEKTK